MEKAFEEFGKAAKVDEVILFRGGDPRPQHPERPDLAAQRAAGADAEPEPSRPAEHVLPLPRGLRQEGLRDAPE